MSKKTYTNGEVTITWEAEKCIHSANCVNGLPEVFQADARPWIKPEGAPTEAIVEQVKQCPSGALGYFYNDADKQESESQIDFDQVVEIMPNGPLMVYGNIAVKYKNGRQEKKHKITAFCRCGSSQNKPYCDGTHKKISFEG
ncbi:(4Fe-4S)-binding protein [Pararhodonellum marinum]|uniref:(4Fe-4S)-binding protein n=1 Tax=Pararhodonellum marinum TaxID=2755358 RepID=UPI001890802B|nr:(4Fe-4S)-binding protein [Pararhodonellum marinum]